MNGTNCPEAGFGDVTGSGDHEARSRVLPAGGDQCAPDCQARECLIQLAHENERLRSEANARIRAETSRNEVLRQMTAADETERGDIARDLHDRLEQILACISMAALNSDVQRLVSDASRHVHELAVRLRPTALDDLGLDAALSTLVREWSNRTGVAADFVSTGLDLSRLPFEVETAFYRVVKDALDNIARHADATRVSVVVARPDGHAALTVEDGHGFDARRPGTERRGLAGMRERVGLLGGSLEVESVPGKGTTVHAWIPLPIVVQAVI